MARPIPVHEQFTDEEKDEIIKLFNKGSTHKEIGELFGRPRRTIMKLCKHLGLKRTVKEAASLKNKSPLDDPDIIQKIRSMRNTHSLSQIAKEVGGSQSAIDRLCRKYEIILDKDAFAAAQSERMKAVWTDEKREVLAGSIYKELNDKEWLEEQYKTKSIGEISRIVGAPLSAVSHHMKRHGIKLRTKDEYLRDLRRKSARKRTITTKWGKFHLQSQAEFEFVQFLGDAPNKVECDPTTLKHDESRAEYVPDFRVDGEYVEIKPPEYACDSGVNRQRFIKQLLVARHNSIDIRCWYKGKYFNYSPIDDLDRYFCLNWKLIFKTPEECYEFLLHYGFRPLKWFKDLLLLGLNNMFKPGTSLNANHPNKSVLNFIKHFNPHFWESTHNGYNCIKDAFSEGNRSVLRSAIQKLWNKKNKINIYGLVDIIQKHFKDFAAVSIFKPWVARTIYRKYLPEGGTIVDPCMGWGGRFLGTLDSNYQYVGIDLNRNSIDAHHSMRKFIGSRLVVEPVFSLGDSSTVEIPNGDLLFTSPPYDDCELYHGIDSYKTKTKPILNNIFSQFNGIIALNLPKRQVTMCTNLANAHNYKLVEELEMKTSSFMGREKTYEPILVFKRI